MAPLSFGRHRGAGLRVVPGEEATPHGLVGDGGWTRLERVLSISAEREVELVCELRARAGRAWFALDSLELERVP